MKAVLLDICFLVVGVKYRIKPFGPLPIVYDSVMAFFPDVSERCPFSPGVRLTRPHFLIVDFLFRLPK